MAQSYECCLVIPCCNEQNYLPDCVASIERAATGGNKKLVIFVINSRINAPTATINSNQFCINFLKSKGCTLGISGNIEYIEGPHFDSLVCDYNSQLQLPLDQGVGLARKIGSDIALRLIVDKTVTSPWIVHTDADAIVPLDYFQNDPFQNTMPSEAVVGIFNFSHAPVTPESAEGYNPEILNSAIRDYHSYLQYYVDGLNYAGSAYAHHTVGSTMSFHHDTYAKVRGYPKREAGEDFYLLNKLSKLGKVIQFATSPITLQGRPSDRVPFGTGQANRKLYELYLNNQAFEIYHPNCFAYLKCYLAASYQYLKDHNYDTYCENLAFNKSTDAGFIAGIALSFEKGLKLAIEQGKDESSRKLHFDTWFDSFKTLKFIHWIRDEFCATLPIQEAFAVRKSMF